MNNLVASVSRLALQGGVLAGSGSLALGIAVNPAVTLLLAAGAVAAYHRQRKRTTTNFGSARFATADDILAAGLLGQPYGVPLGYAEGAGKPGFGHALQRLFDPGLDADLATRLFLSTGARRSLLSDQPLRLPDGVHTAIFAAPGRGKTTGLIIPALLSDPSSAFVIDPKGEIALATANFRAKHFGKKTFVLDPYGVLGGGTHQLNPLQEIDPASDTAPEYLLDLGNALVPRSGKEAEPHWLDSAEVSLVAGMAFALSHGDPQQRHLPAVQEIIADSAARTAAIALIAHSDIWGGALRRLAHQVGHFKDREEASVLSSTLRQLNFLHSPAISHVLRETTIDVGELIRGEADLFIVMPPDRMQGPQAGFVRVILATITRRLFREGTSNSRRLMFYLDEAACLGKMTVLDQLLAVGRGYGARLILAWQSMGQLLSTADPGAAQTLLSCIGCQVFLGAPNDYQTAEVISNMLGEKTIAIASTQGGYSRSWSESAGQQASQQYSTSSSGSTTHSEQGRKLLQPSETFNLSPRQAIVFLPGRCRPLLTTMPRYFEDPAFASQRSGFKSQVKVLLHSLILCASACMFLFGLGIALHEQQHSPPQQPVPPLPVLPMPDPMARPLFRGMPSREPFFPQPPYVASDPRRQRPARPPASFIISPRNQRKELDHE